MSKYTTMFRWPIEQRLDAEGLDHVESNWPSTYAFAGLSDYPIFDEAHRDVLNSKIYRRYWYREIGFETWGQFRWYLRAKMHEIMPYYNQLYESELLEIVNPLYNKDMWYDESWTRDESINTDEVGTDDRTQDSTGRSDSTASTDERNVFQDTPMNGLATGAIEAMQYATSVTYDDSSTESQTQTTSHTTYDQDTTSKRDETGDYEGTKSTHERGHDVAQSDLLTKYRDTFLNIDLMVVEELSPLFLGLW